MSDNTATPARSPFSLPNVRLFILFRVLFNARYYYPVYALIFLDYGLNISQFLLLNMIWAFGIVLTEVPSGALADTIGRRKLLIGGGVLMTIEIALFAFAPTSNTQLLFGLLVANRIISGIAEALVSGADEALAYDTLKAEGLERQWDRVLSRLMQFQSLAFVGALATGALVYDERVFNQLFALLGIDWTLDRANTMRFPLYLTLINAVIITLAALRMQEPERAREPAHRGESALAHYWRQVRASFTTMIEAGRWIGTTRFAIVVITGGFLVDAILRTFVTFNSQYYQIIGIPESLYGIIGGALSALGFFWPPMARKMAKRFSPAVNFGIIATLALIGLSGVTFMLPYIGVVWVVFIMMSWSFLNFFGSYYLNAVTPSERRATVLSFRGLAFNLAYGIATWIMSRHIALLEPGVIAQNPHLDERALENAKFIAAAPALPIAFLIMGVSFLVLCRFYLRPRDVPAFENP